MCINRVGCVNEKIPDRYEMNWADLHMRNDHGRQIHVVNSRRLCKKGT